MTIFLSGIIGYQCSELPKPTYTRTMLKVSRSLPGETEELKVRTSEGKLTTLIVKRKERPPIFDNFKTLNPSSNSQERSQQNDENSSAHIDFQKPHSWSNNNENDVRPLEVAHIQRIRAQLVQKNESEIKNASDKQIFQDRNKAIDYGNWKPIDESASDQENANNDHYPNWHPVSTENKVSRNNLVLISNFREREERRLNPIEDKPARLLNNQAEPYAFFPHEPRPLRRTNIGANLMKNRDAKNVPPEVTITSELNVKSAPKRSTITVDVDGTPIVHGQRVPDDPIDKFQTWRNARVINNRLIPDGAMSVTVDPSTFYHSSDNLVDKQRFKHFFEDVNRRYLINFD